MALCKQTITVGNATYPLSLLVFETRKKKNSQTPILNSFSALTEETRALSEKFILILSVGIVLRSIPMTVIVGVLRAGGDVKFCLYQDLIAQWVIGIPLAAIAAIYLKFTPEWMYLLFLTEEVIKWGGSLYRIKTRKWIKNLIEN